MASIDPNEQAQFTFLSRHPELLYKIVQILQAAGTPTQETVDRALTINDDTNTLVCTGSRIFTVNAGLGVGFGVAAKGTCSFAPGTAIVTDVRVAGVPNPWCALVQTGVDTYDVVGSTL